MVYTYDIADRMYDAFYGSARELYIKGKQRNFSNQQWVWIYEMTQYAIANFINEFEKKESPDGQENRKDQD